MPDDYDTQQSAFRTLIGHALVDANFRSQLKDANKRGDAMRSMGIEPTPEIERALDDAMASVDRLAQQFGDVQAAT